MLEGSLVAHSLSFTLKSLMIVFIGYHKGPRLRNLYKPLPIIGLLELGEYTQKKCHILTWVNTHLLKCTEAQTKTITMNNLGSNSIFD